MNINFEYYKIFYYVAKYHNFTKAAKVLESSQPNVTRAMNCLEQQMHSTLFVRTNRGVQLTPEGEKLYMYVSAAMHQLLTAEEELADYSGMVHGSISIGASETALNIYLFDKLRSFHTAYPGIRLRIYNHSTPQAYERYFSAGAERYLLRHETADKAHYEKLHPKEMSFDNRIRCLHDLKEIGYQTGCGFMVGSPYQTVDTLYEDLCLIKELEPEMCGIGPFIPQADTPFGKEAAGTLEMTLRLLSIIRLIHPTVLLPATTALGTIHPLGREKGILAGANVVMPNLSPVGVRKKYLLYDNKICTGEEASECCGCMMRRMQEIGYEVVVDRGDHPLYDKKR